MADPAVCGDTEAEYFEILNMTNQTVDLDGLYLQDSANSTTLSGALLVGPGDRVIIAADVAGFANCYVGLTAQADVTFGLNNTGGDLIRLSVNGGTVFDEVDFRGWVLVPGRSWQLSEDTFADWCLSEDDLGNGNFGTPGTANPDCMIETDTDTNTQGTIPDVRQGAFTLGTLVTVEGVYVTGVTGSGFFVQDPVATTYAGIYVHTGTSGAKPSTGQTVDVTGAYVEFASGPGSLAELSISGAAGASWSVSSLVASAPAVPVIPLATLVTDFELYESMVVSLDDALDYTVLTSPDQYGEWTFEVSGGDVFRVDDKLFDLAGTLTGFSAGDGFDMLTGVVDYAFSSGRLLPRDASDVTGFVDVP